MRETYSRENAAFSYKKRKQSPELRAENMSKHSVTIDMALEKLKQLTQTLSEDPGADRVKLIDSINDQVMLASLSMHSYIELLPSQDLKKELEANLYSLDQFVKLVYQRNNTTATADDIKRMSEYISHFKSRISGSEQSKVA